MISHQHNPTDKSRSAVIVGCARNCELFLPGTLENIGKLASLYAQTAFIFVENDSSDQTAAILRDWLYNKPQSSLISLDGLADREKRRTARLAITRNAYMDRLREAGLTEFDHLIIVDFDDVNCQPIAVDTFGRAKDFLDRSEEIAAVFANQLPYYYDIWALRHDVWCPGDCWAQINNRPAYMPYHRAVEKYVYARQTRIAPDSEPIAVRSAFGGIAIYKMEHAKDARYVGTLPNGGETCEHVAFNGAIAQTGKKLYILPSFLNFAPQEHLKKRISGWERMKADLDPNSYRHYPYVMTAIRRIGPRWLWGEIRRRFL